MWLTNRPLWVPRWQHREATGVYDAQACDAKNPRLGVNHGILIRLLAHRTRSRCMVHRRRCLHHNLENISIRRDIAPGEKFGAADDDFADRVCFKHLAGALEARGGDFLVPWVEEPVGADDGVVCGVRGSDGYVAPREGRHDAGEGIDIVAAVRDCGGDESAVEKEEFNVGPVWSELLIEVGAGGIADGACGKIFECCWGVGGSQFLIPCFQRRAVREEAKEE